MGQASEVTEATTPVEFLTDRAIPVEERFRIVCELLDVLDRRLQAIENIQRTTRPGNRRRRLV